MRNVAVIAAAGLVAAASVLLWPRESPGLVASSVQGLGGSTKGLAPARQSHVAAGSSDTAPGGVYREAVSRFEIGYAGGVLVNEDTRRVLEMVASNSGEPASEADLQRFEAALATNLPHEEVSRIMSLTRGYLAYSVEMNKEVPVTGVPESLAEVDATMSRIDGIRRRHFDADTQQALFGPHDRYARLVDEAGFVERDPALSGEQKIARLSALRAQLPAEQQALISAPAISHGS
jgi:hypothetical protein